MENLPSWAQVLSVLTPLLIAAFAGVGSIRANRRSARTEEKKVDSAAFDKAVALYDKSIAQMDEQVKRSEREVANVRAELDEMRTQLRTERHDNEKLRRENTMLRTQVEHLQLRERELTEAYESLKDQVDQMNVNGSESSDRSEKG